MSSRKVYKNILHPELSYKVVGGMYKAHNELGRYRNEKQYCDYIEEYFNNSKINYKREYGVPLSFKGEKPRRCIVDFLIEERIVLEVKACRIITRKYYYQIQRYLASTGIDLGMLVNFRDQYLKVKRVMNISKYNKN